MPITEDTGFTREEVGLALRNPGMPLEALRRPITPIGMHYVLVHFDVPDLDAAASSSWSTAACATPLTLTLDELRARPAVTMPVMMECAGSGRAHLARARVGALARRGDRLRRVDRHAAAGRPRGRRPARRRRGAPLHRPRPRHRPGRRAGLPAQPHGRGGHGRRRPARLRDERRSRCRPRTASRCASSSPSGTGWPRSSGCARSPPSRSRSRASSRRCSTATAARRTSRERRSRASSRAR